MASAIMLLDILEDKKDKNDYGFSALAFGEPGKQNTMASAVMPWIF